MRGLLIIISISLLNLTCGKSGGGGDDQPTLPGGSGVPTNDKPVQIDTELYCPNGTQLTYDNFGKGFLQSHCLSCHHSSLEEGSRFGAPLDYNFETYELALSFRLSMFQTVEGITVDMPPASYIDEFDRDLFIEWLACGSPEN